MKWFWINQLQNNSQSSNRELKASRKCLCNLSYYYFNTDHIECQKYHNSCVTYGKNACQEYPPTKTTLQSGNLSECILIKKTFNDGFQLKCQKCNKYYQTCNVLSSNYLACDPKYKNLDLSSFIDNQNVNLDTILEYSVLTIMLKVVVLVQEFQISIRLL